jgi:hypothetical protein
MNNDVPCSLAGDLSLSQGYMFENIRLYIDFEEFRKVTDEEQLYKLFAKQFPKTPISSPFRVDKHPSFTYYKKRGRWFWYDQSTGEGGDIYDYIRRDQNHLDSFQDVLSFINEKLFLRLEQPVQYRHVRVLDKQSRIMKNLTRTVFMQVIRKKWSQDEYTLWNRWNISPDILSYYRVYAASQLWKRNEEEQMELLWVRRDDNPIFFYHFPRTRHIKAYRPLEQDKKHKFIGNASSEDVQGYEQCRIKERRPHLLILTKAMKECMFYRSWGMDAMAKQGEGHHIDPDFIRHLRRYCGRIISFYDNDRAGIHGAWQLRNEFGIPAFFIPKQFKAKNITDLWQINKPLAYRVLEEIANFTSYRTHLRSYRNLLLHDLESVESSGASERLDIP